MNHRFPFKWYLKDGYPAKGIKKHGLKVFSCFACGGGSTMGYKLAGYDVLGCNEIDKKIIEVYKLNHKPKFAFNEDIRTFRKRDDLPEELFNLDILDGSPPCSSFSMVGNREKDWGKKKQFTEGQAFQTLDDLFFEFIALAERLQPKVVISENVKGLISGHAKGYVKEIFKGFDKAGYNTQLFLMNAAFMGVPQKRGRVFFISTRKDLKMPKIKLAFNEKPITFSDVDKANNEPDKTIEYSDLYKKYWNESKQGEVVGKFNATSKRVRMSDVCYTITAQTGYTHAHPTECRQLSKNEILLVSSFPLDFNLNGVKTHYLCGMSVPPVMTAQIATAVKEQLFNA